MDFYIKAIKDKLEVDGKFTWKNIVDAIKGTKHEPKNWLDVRCALQIFIDNRIIERTNDLFIEEYIILED